MSYKVGDGDRSDANGLPLARRSPSILVTDSRSSRRG